MSEPAKRNRLYPWLGLLAVVILLLVISFAIRGFQTRPLADGQQRRVVVDTTPLEVTVAASEASRAKGLMGTTALTDNSGMLFVFPVAAQQSFWMKGMSYPIDIVWINHQTVTDITANVPSPAADTPDAELPKYTSAGPADRALEVRAGWAAAHGIQPGDPIKVQ